jgi:DivIVA domain-containing protein
MPDQSSAATEHAIIQEITAPLATLPDDALPIAANADFTVVLRGYDRESVDAYVRKTSQLVAELQATRSPEAAVRRALERVGEQISGILQRAHEAAQEITRQSRSEAEERLMRAREEAAQIIGAARERLHQLDTDTDRIWDERHRIVDDTRALARELQDLAEAAAARFPAEPARNQLEGEEAGGIARLEDGEHGARHALEGDPATAQLPAAPYDVAAEAAGENAGGEPDETAGGEAGEDAGHRS